MLLSLTLLLVLAILTIATRINSVDSISYSRQMKLILSTLMFCKRLGRHSFFISPLSQGIVLAVILSMLSYICSMHYIYSMDNVKKN